MKDALKYAIDANCSDIHITEGKFIKVRYLGIIRELPSFPVVDVEQITEFVKEFVPHRYEKYDALLNDILNRDIDTSFSFSGRRFRANIYKSTSGVNIALRILNDVIPTSDDLKLPPTVAKFTQMTNGLVLVIGATGTGKSTTIASLLNKINQTSYVNILTIEDPIEYIYKEECARIEQREVGNHISSFSEAVRGAMRQDPDIILVGELRDLDTIQNTITLAETGHLVFGTLHAKSVAETIDRIIDVFPAEQQEQIRIQLASVLRGIVHQKLVKGKKDTRIPLIEILMVDDVVSGMIKQKQKPNSFRDYLRSQKDTGNVHLVDNIVWHCKANRLDVDSIKNYLSPEDYSLVKSLTGNLPTFLDR